jgi:hypothetical protein
MRRMRRRRRRKRRRKEIGKRVSCAVDNLGL